MNMPSSYHRNAARLCLAIPGPFLFAARNDAANRRAVVVGRRKFCWFVCVSLAAAVLFAGATSAEPMATEAPAVTTGPFANFVTQAAQRFAIPASWIRAVMQVESAGEVRALSPKGAMGLMQIMPETWLMLRAHYSLGADPFDPRDNILAGAAYLRELHDRYGSPGFLAAYNAGLERYDDYLATGRPLPGETQAYVATITPLIDGTAIGGTRTIAVAAHSWTDAPLFTDRSGGGSGDANMALEAPSAAPASDDPVPGLRPLDQQTDRLFVATTEQKEQP
jgi:hypothetical protein